MGILYKAISDKIIGICIDIHKELGPGFLEKQQQDKPVATRKQAGRFGFIPN